MKPMTDLLYHTVSARTSRFAAAAKPDPIRLLLCWAVLGIGAGTLLYGAAPAFSARLLLTQGLAVSDEARSLWEVCRTALCPLLILLGGIWLSGCAAFGQPAALLLLFSRGTAFGLAAAECCANYPLRDGIVITAALILPFGFCSILLLCYAVRDALSLSNRMTKFLLYGTAEPECCTQGHDRLTDLLGILLLAIVAAGLHTLLLYLLNDRLLA